MTIARDRTQEVCEDLAPDALNTKDLIAALTAEIEPFETSAITETVFSEHNTQKEVKQQFNNFIEQILAIEGDFLDEANKLEGLAKEARDITEERAFLSIAQHETSSRR